MKSQIRSSLVAIAFTLVANVTLAHAATAPAHHGHRAVAAGGMQAKAMMILGILWIKLQRSVEMKLGLSKAMAAQ